MRLLVLGLIWLVSSSVIAEEAWVANFENSEAQQHTSEWCWAACAEMALRAGGASVSQETIVASIKGYLAVQGASDLEISRALNSCGFNADGKVWRANAVYHRGAPIPSVLVKQITDNHPVVITFATGPMSGHAVIIHKVEYTQSYAGPVIADVTVFDPFLGQDEIEMGANVLATTTATWYVNVSSTGGHGEARTTEQRTCPQCGGVGRITTTATCRACGGTGLLICATCGGSGYVRNYFGGASPCPACYGRGRLVCATCRGSGSVAVTVTCPRCRGSGQITVSTGTTSSSDDD